MLRRSRVSGRKKIALAANISSSKYYSRYVPGPTCRGSVPLYMPPFSYKRGGMQRYNTSSIFRLRLSILKLPQQSNTQWSRVLRSGGPNHSKSSHVHVLDDRLAGQAKRLSPFLILGFRAGALRHQAGEFPLRQRGQRASQGQQQQHLL
jgi:hypothetical protein